MNLNFSSVPLHELIAKIRSMVNEPEIFLHNQRNTTMGKKDLEDTLKVVLKELCSKEKTIEDITRQYRESNLRISQLEQDLYEERTKKADRSEWENKLLRLVKVSKQLMAQAFYSGITPMAPQERLRMKDWLQTATTTLKESDDNSKEKDQHEI